MATYSARTALLGNLIDYAGTFPPAALPLEKALREACVYRRRARHPWLLAKIVVTISDLKKITPRAWFEAGSDGTPLPLTVIGSPVEKAPDLARHVGFELREIRHFNEKFLDSSQRQQVLAYETRLPETAAGDEIQALIHDALEAGLDGATLGLDLYIEVPLSGEWQDRLSRSVRALSDWCEEYGTRVGQPGIKIRTGGKLTPTPIQLAEVIAACATHQVRFKATQGLHHAITRKGDYGFVNLFAAFAFAHVLGTDSFDTAATVACLEETQASAFAFDGPVLSWGKFRLDADQIEAARRRHGGTFGSCSLDEPDLFLFEELGEEKP